MKTAINCDETFERLTAGRLDGNDEASRAIRAHLQECDSCRQIAEALRPALHLIHEALPHAERDGLPTYLPESEASESDGALDHVAATERIMQQVRVVSRPEPQAAKGVGFGGSTSLWSVVACVAAVLAISWFQTMAVEPAAEQVPVITKSDLAAACFAMGNVDTPLQNAATRQLALDCCTKCHVASSDLRIPKQGIQKVLLACQQCHVDI